VRKFSLVADGFEPETSARKLNVCVVFEVHNGGGAVKVAVFWVVINNIYL
jgi:hypothetical protein